MTTSASNTLAGLAAQIVFTNRENISELACSKLTENFSPSTWIFFFHEEKYQLICPNLPQGQ